jgi:peptidyl-tRNA hydrolase, PTH1 family
MHLIFLPHSNHRQTRYNSRMKCFMFGLGNPGEKYATTRHNVGFMALEQAVRSCSSQEFAAQAREQSKLHAKLYRVCDIFFAEPETYMNDSGRAVLSTIEYFDKELAAQIRAGQPAGSLEKPTVIVFYDDLDIALGEWKIQFGRGPKVHNGVNSVRQYLGSDLFLHVRIGIDGRQGQRLQSGSEYVLTPFYGEERTVIAQTLEMVVEDVLKRVR